MTTAVTSGPAAADIVVIGAGFAGFWAAIAARRIVGSGASVALVAREPTLQVRPRLYEACPAALALDLAPALARTGVAFVRGEATDVDAGARRVALAGGGAIDYRRLVVATGSVMRRPPIPGALQADSIDTVDEAIAFDRRLAAIAARERPGVVAIVGAGFTGIELALEMRDRVVAHRAHAPAPRVVLVDRAARAGDALGPGPQAAIAAALAAAGVEARCGATIASMDAGGLRFADGSTLAADAVVLCTGLAAAPFAAALPGARDPLGRLVVARSLRLPAAPQVFVAGDAASADTGDGHATLPSCQHALQTGRFAGENAARDLLGMATLDYRQPRYVTCLDLGRAGAVFTHGWSREVVADGADAKAIKRRINTEIIYPPLDADAATLIARSSTDPDAQARATLAPGDTPGA